MRYAVGGTSDEGRTPRGVRELKRRIEPLEAGVTRRTPRGVRELKPFPVRFVKPSERVAPLAGCVN